MESSSTTPYAAMSSPPTSTGLHRSNVPLSGSPAVHHHAILPCALGCIQSLIGQLHQLISIHQRFVDRGHSHADRDGLVLPLLRRNPLHHAPRQSHRAVLSALR